MVEGHARLRQLHVEGHRAGRELQHALALGDQDHDLDVVLARPGPGPGHHLPQQNPEAVDVRGLRGEGRAKGRALGASPDRWSTMLEL